MASGIADAFAATRPTLDAIANAMTFGMTEGNAPQSFVDVIRRCAGTCSILKTRAPHVVEGDISPVSQINIWARVVGVVLDIARKAEFGVPIAAAALPQYPIAVDMSRGREDDAAVAKVYARDAALTLTGGDAR